MRYRLRFFFDPGSGTLLWSANDEARERFGYPIDPADLPLSSRTASLVEELVRRYDESIDWSYPPDPTPWTADECERFNREVAALREVLRAELGTSFELVDEFKPVVPGPNA